MSGWTEERVEQLKKLWLLGWSASQIAKELGAVTRNAVIGKIHRLDLVARQTPKLTPPAALSSFASASFMGSKLGKTAFSAPISVTPAATPASPYQTPGVAFAQLAARGQGKMVGKTAGQVQGSQGGQSGLTQGRALPEKAASLAAYGSYGASNERPLDRITSLMGGRGAGRQCQWPVGDPRSAGFHFCGCASLEAQPYCGEHAKLAYQPSGKSRRVNVGGGDLHASGTPDEREISIRA